MIVEQALRLAGDNAHLVARPHGRLHVYTGPLTPSGRSVPRAARAVCRAHTRRLQVVTSRGSSLDASSERVLCARCSARLLPRGRAEQHPTTRAGFLTRYAGTTKADVAVALMLAETPTEVDAAAHLSLVLFDVGGTRLPFQAHGRSWPALHDLVVAARTRVRGFPEDQYRGEGYVDVLGDAARRAVVDRPRSIRAENEARIARLGINNAKPIRVRRPVRGARP